MRARLGVRGRAGSVAAAFRLMVPSMGWRFDRDRARCFSRFIWQRFIDEMCFETAGALSYTTLVSLVPLMVAVLAMFSVFPVIQPARNMVLDFAFSNFVPTAGQKVQATLEQFAATAEGLPGASVLVL